MRQDPLRQALKRASFFQGVGSEELHLLQATMRRRRLEHGEFLFREGDHGDSMALLAHGRLGVRVRNQQGIAEQIDTIEPGDVVGEMACIDPAPRSASILGLERSLIYELDRHLLAYLRREAPSLVAAVVGSVISQLTERLRSATLRIEEELHRLAGGAEPSPAPLPRMASGPKPRRHRGELHLVDVEPLRGLSERDLARLSSVAPARVWDDRALLCHEGDRGASCFFIVEGDVDVVKTMRGKRRRLATLSQGSLVGQAALIAHAPRSASLRARGTVIAFELDRATYERLLSQANPLALRFQEEIAISGIRQLRGANARLVQVLSKGPCANASAATAPAPARPARGEDPLTFVQASLGEWGMTVEDLDEIELVTPEGLATASEAAARRRH